MLKGSPVADYPTEAGCFLRGNDYSPVAVVVLLNAPYGTLPPEVQSIPAEIEKLVRVAIETGAALSGTLQTENIGIEKIICNVVGNPNIRYLVLCGEEVNGHITGTALKALIKEGINDKRTIIGSQAKTPYLFNIPLEASKRFREQTTLVDLTREMNPEIIAKAVWSCYQENPTPFQGFTLCDPGAFAETGLSCRLTWRVKHPEEIESWEIDEGFLKKIEEPLEKVGGETMKGNERILSLTKRLLKVTEELAGIARLCIEELERPDEEALREKRLEEEKPKPTLPVREEALTEEELYFANQLRGYKGVLAAFKALDRDICHDGCSLPAAVISASKRLKNLKVSLDKSSLSQKKKGKLRREMAEFEGVLQGLPQDTSQSCQKSVGKCTIGSGCFANSSLDLLKLVTEPALPPKV
ncbi:MAG: tetrahydromethanopterin S-methyltransferase subunit A [Proteobacteria bacterium]|nr:tetrahydromethanopterin S-methyltransferase subunit A [Pseudomonadota bacterium]MBU1965303.1 tetrahydromethanopterin S-methyltransferase subunit A [Pseudomonadota bacterium]